MERIGIIGVGLLGSSVASRLLKRDFEVKGYDTRPEQIKALCAQGLIAARSIAEVAADTREGCRGNPLWLPLRAGTGACPYNLNPLPPMDGEEVIGDLPVQCHVWVI